MRLYHLSKENLDGKTMYPRVPKTVIDGFEDNVTPRVCFSKSISGAIRAIDSWGNYGIYYVHIIDGSIYPENIVKCTEDMVSDSIVTDEYWVTCPVKLKCIAKISIGFNDNEYNINRRYKKHYYENTNDRDGYTVKYPVHFKYLERYYTDDMIDDPADSLTERLLTSISSGIKKVFESENILVIDNDSSISYNKSKINADANLPVINNFDELQQHINNGDDLTLFDTSKCLTLILDDNSEIALHQYTGQHVLFLKLFNPILKATNNEILIYVDNNHCISKSKMSWSSGAGGYKIIFPDQTLAMGNVNSYKLYLEKHPQYNGYDKTMYIRHIAEDYGDDNYESFKYCYKQFIERPGNGYYQGYLPANGQMQIMTKYLDIINYVFRKVIGNNGFGEDTFVNKLNIDTDYWWTSTETTQGSAACNIIGDTDKLHYKEDYAYVLPLFKQIKSY